MSEVLKKFRKRSEKEPFYFIFIQKYNKFVWNLCPKQILEKSQVPLYLFFWIFLEVLMKFIFQKVAEKPHFIDFFLKIFISIHGTYDPEKYRKSPILFFVESFIWDLVIIWRIKIKLIRGIFWDHKHL